MNLGSPSPEEFMANAVFSLQRRDLMSDLPTVRNLMCSHKP